MGAGIRIGIIRPAEAVRVYAGRQMHVLTPNRPLITVVGVRGAPGAPGAPGPVGSITGTARDGVLHSFAFGDATPDIIYTPAQSVWVVRVTVTIITPFNGVGAQIKVGVLGDLERYVPAAHVDPTVAADYETEVTEDLVAGNSVYLSITPGIGATAGTGRITIEVVYL